MDSELRQIIRNACMEKYFTDKPYITEEMFEKHRGEIMIRTSSMRKLFKNYDKEK